MVDEPEVESPAPAEVSEPPAEVVQPPPTSAQPVRSSGLHHAVGRRKTAVARVFLRPGKGVIRVNRKDFEAYFGTPGAYRAIVEAPFRVTSTEGQFAVWANVSGGGTAAQAQAIRHGISRALAEMNEDYHLPLKRAGLLTRDPRMVERKKYGRKKARRGFQWTKR
ncbi:MAG: 30S ribosomal protein S9 [Nitrospirae bacterium]|nr:30S ribosomal protein S9 [Nitrospirota bacterium]